MDILQTLKDRFRGALSSWPEVDPEKTNIDALLAMIQPSQDPKFGDYQANCAMPLGKQLQKPPRDVAQQLVERLAVDDMCEDPEIAGPGFINLRLADDWLTSKLQQVRSDPRIGVDRVAAPGNYVIDFSSPNVAKPMHVGHIRSTVIGDALARTLRFLGHHVVTDNHLGDWGTQFGMIIYGYRHFVDPQAYGQAPVAELGRVYRVVRGLIDYHEGRRKLPQLAENLAQIKKQLQVAEAEPVEGDAKVQKKAQRRIAKLQQDVERFCREIQTLEVKLKKVDDQPTESKLAADHVDIAEAVLHETAKLHAGDLENKKLWDEFLPSCRDEIQKLYSRLDVSFDEELGESFYHDQLAEVVANLTDRGLAKPSEGAICVFLDEFASPMIVQKRDGAFLYATTDLATIKYRMDRWKPDAILYVVDFRQGEHFAKLFRTARAWGFEDVELTHVSFGTVLGEDGRAFKTRAGDTVSLESLLDQAVARALRVVSENDDQKKLGPELDQQQREHVANVIGHAAIKYADLSQNRTSDYVFSYDKMVAMQGNTATYLQYSYARIQNIFSKGQVQIESLVHDLSIHIQIGNQAERHLALKILQFEEALNEVVIDYRPHLLCNYLYQLAKRFAEFYEASPVLKADDLQVKQSRLLLCELTRRTLQLGLNLLGIQVVDKM